MLQPEQRGPSEGQSSQPLTQDPPQTQPTQPTQDPPQSQPTQPTQPKGNSAATKGAKGARKRKLDEINGQN